MNRREEYTESRRADHGPVSRQAVRGVPCRVTDVMATDVVTVDKNMPYKQVARLLAENDLTSIPVLSGDAHHITRLPVVRPSGDLIGVVSRKDLLSVFLRPDAEIAAEIADNLMRVTPAGQPRITVSVTDGEVLLTGDGMIGTAVKIALDVAGVVAVTRRLTVSDAAAESG